MAKKVFFSFHYQDVIDLRANVVRNSWVTKEDREEAGFFDSSLWESSRRRGADSLKQLIGSGLHGTSVTAVLIGTQTYARRWVRYEIMKSLKKGNKLIGIHINSIACRNQQTKADGPNPFDYLAVKFNEYGDSVTPCEWDGKQWVFYNDLLGWSLSRTRNDKAGELVQLTQYSRCYDWSLNDGYNNFSTWID